jgi:hypothetical protein
MKLSYDRQSVGQSFLGSGSYLELITICFPFCLLVTGLLMWYSLSDERMSLYFTCTTASESCQSSDFLAQVPWNSRPYFTVSFEIPPARRARSSYLYPSRKRWPSYTPRHWVPCSSPLKTRWANVEVFSPHSSRMSSILIKVEVEVNSRLTVSQHVLVSSPLWDLLPDITSYLKVYIWKLLSYFYGAPSLTKRQVCSLQCNHSRVRVVQNP